MMATGRFVRRHYNQADMMTSAPFSVRIVAWEETAETLGAIRRTVFVEEQAVPPELEWDGIDPQCEHALATSATGEPIGTGRLLPDGHVGRMAVLRAWRRHGVGTAILRLLIERARALGHAEAVLNAQTYVQAFYRAEGFVASGPEFMEAGIPHVRMHRRL